VSEKKKERWTKKILNLDNPPIYAILLILLVLPLFFPFNTPVPITPMVKALYDKIESLKPGDVVLLDFSWGYGFKMLHEAGHVAILKHLLSRPGVKIVMVAFFDATSELSWRDVMAQVNIEKNYPDKKYGKDWIWLGYIPGGEPVVLGFADNPWKVAPKDKYGTPIEQYPDFYETVKTGADFALVIEGGGHGGINGHVTGGFLKSYGLKYHCWLAYNMDPSVIAEFYPYYPSIIKSMLNGNAGAAEYERLLNTRGRGSTMVDALSMSHMYAVVLIIFANIIYIYDRYLERKEKAKTATRR